MGLYLTIYANVWFLDDGGESNLPCVFPFEYAGKSLTTCLKHGTAYHWCSTESVYQGRFRKCVKGALSKDSSRNPGWANLTVKHLVV